MEKLRWQRIPVREGKSVVGKDGEKRHSHAFYRDGEDKWVVNAEVRRWMDTSVDDGDVDDMADRRDGWEG